MKKYILILKIFFIPFLVLSKNNFPSQIKEVHIYCQSPNNIIKVNEKNLNDLHRCEDIDTPHKIKVIWNKEPQEIELSIVTYSAMTIMQEGPHIDLKNWKKSKSTPQKLKNEKGFYQIKENEPAKFPKSTKEEMKEALSKELKKYSMDNKSWLKLLEECQGDPTKYPCGVSPSMKEIILSLKGKTFKIRIDIPMGC